MPDYSKLALRYTQAKEVSMREKIHVTNFAEWLNKRQAKRKEIREEVEYVEIYKPKVCPIHGSRWWVPSEPPGNEYCSECARERKRKAPRCPTCGTKEGFAPGTGDCGCGEDYVFP